MTLTQFIQLPILGHKGLCFSTRNFVISKTTMWPFFCFSPGAPGQAPAELTWRSRAAVSQGVCAFNITAQRQVVLQGVYVH